MKNSNVKSFLVGALAATMVTTTVVPVVAQNIDVVRGVKIFVDEEELRGAEGFIYDGTTYLPVRKISEALDKPVAWDGKTKSVYIGKHESATPAVMLADMDCFNSKVGFSRESSAKDNMGNTYHDVVKLGYSRGFEEYKINGRYQKIKGRMILGYEDKSKKGCTWVKIYGDGKLLYTSPDFTAGVEPVDFEVDLTGVLTLKIERDYKASLGDYGDPNVYIVNTGLYQ